MSTTIDSLDIQIKTSAGQSAQNIERLADALEKLKVGAKLTTVINNLTRLKNALESLSNTSGFESKLQNITKALDGLSAIKNLSSFSSMISSLKKIPDVLSKLDSATLDQFRKKMEELAKSLAPLATNINAVAQGFSKLPKNVRTATSAVGGFTTVNRNMGNAVNMGNLNLFAAIQNYGTLIHTVNSVIQVVSGFLSQAIEWDGIQFRFGRAFGEDAEEVYAYVLKINEALGINIQEFMQYSSLYGSLLSGFGMAQEKVTAISVGLTELSYDIWAAYNDRFKTLEHASEAVRSAITGEIEPIRNAGIALTEASLQEYIDSTHLAGISIEKLSEAQKAEVRYAAMVNAAMNQGIVGTYAREMDTAEGAVRSLTQSFKTLTQALGSLFIPLLQVAVPYITAIVELLTEVVFWVAELFGIPMQKIDWSSTSKGVGGIADGAKDAADGLGSAANAAKKLKSYTMGFDELNVIDPNSASGSKKPSGSSGASGWGEGLDLKSLWDESVFAQASKRVDELKNKLLGFLEEWKTELSILAAALGALSLAKMLTGLGTALSFGEKFLGVMSTIAKIASSAIVITLQFALQKEFFSKFMGDDGSFWDYVTALLIGGGASWILYSMWGPGGLVIGLGVTAIASLSSIIENGGVDNAQGAIVAITGIATAVGALSKAWSILKTSKFAVAIGEFFTSMSSYGGGVTGFLYALDDISPKAATGVYYLLKPLSDVTMFIQKFISALTGFTAPIGVIVAGVLAAIASAAYFVYKNWSKLIDIFKNFFKLHIAPKLKEIGEHFKGLWDSIVSFKDAIVDAFDRVRIYFSNATLVKKIFEAIGIVIEKVGGIIFTVVGGVITWAFTTMIGLIEEVIQFFTGLGSAVLGVVEFIVTLFTGGKIENSWKKIWTGVVKAVSAIPQAIIGIIKDFVGSVIDWFTELWDVLVGHSIVPDTVEAIIEWFLSLPKKILKPIQDFVNSIVTKFKNMWSDIKKWFKENVAPKFTSKYWEDVFQKVVDGASSKLEEAKASIEEKWKKIKEWFDANVKPIFTLKYWKDIFQTVIDGASSKLSEVKTTIEGKWGEVKAWYDKNVAPKFTTSYWKGEFDSLRSGLKEKLDEAWKEVKKFFSASEWKKKVEDAVKAIKDNFKMPEFKKIKLDVTFSTDVGPIKTAVYKALGLSGWPSLKWSTYAMGGMPSMGEMFIAREAGPELVGRIGNKSAVVNNDQIVAAVSQGVYTAVVSAMSGGGNGGQAVNVYLDGKQIYASVKKAEAQKGANIFGNQLEYGY